MEVVDAAYQLQRERNAASVAEWTAKAKPRPQEMVEN